jgi:hypothetical protein
MIYLPQTATNLRGAAWFSTKRTEVNTMRLQTLDVPENFCTCITQCVPHLPVFTDEVGTDYWKNDLTSIWMQTVNVINDAGVLVIASTIVGTITNLNTGASQTLVDTTHGTLNVGSRYWWFTIDWTKIQALMGYGNYEITVTESSIYGTNPTLNEFASPTYTLKPWSQKLANRTVRIETSQRGKLHHGNDYSNTTALGRASGTTYYPINYTNQVRLPGALKWSGTEDEQDHLVLKNSDRSSYQIKDQMKPKYDLTIDLVSSYQSMSVIFDDLFSNPVKVTDYNVYNWVADPRDNYANQYRSIPLVRESDSFEADSGALRKSFTFGMRYANDNVFKTNN